MISRLLMSNERVMTKVHQGGMVKMRLQTLVPMENINIIDILLAILIITGLLGTLIPALPGTAVILGGTVIHGLVTGFTIFDWKFLLLLVIIFYTCTSIEISGNVL